MFIIINDLGNITGKLVIGIDVILTAKAAYQLFKT